MYPEIKKVVAGNYQAFTLNVFFSYYIVYAANSPKLLPLVDGVLNYHLSLPEAIFFEPFAKLPLKFLVGGDVYLLYFRYVLQLLHYVVYDRLSSHFYYGF